MEAAQAASVSLHLSKCHIVGNHMSRLICPPLVMGEHKLLILKNQKTSRNVQTCMQGVKEQFYSFSESSLKYNPATARDYGSTWHSTSALKASRSLTPARLLL